MCVLVCVCAKKIVSHPCPSPNSLQIVTKSREEREKEISNKMMNIPAEFMARRGSLESRKSLIGSPPEPPTKHSRTQSLKERLLSRKLPKLVGDKIAPTSSFDKIAPTSSCDVTDLSLMSNRGLFHSRDGSVSSRSKAEDVDRKTTTNSSSTITRFKKLELFLFLLAILLNNVFVNGFLMVLNFFIFYVILL